MKESKCSLIWRLNRAFERLMDLRSNPHANNRHQHEKTPQPAILPDYTEIPALLSLITSPDDLNAIPSYSDYLFTYLNIHFLI